ALSDSDVVVEASCNSGCDALRGGGAVEALSDGDVVVGASNTD
ncbi:12564_t:CDS:2, partial [Racocetra fulgida]